jgi:hypothetical protein
LVKVFVYVKIERSLFKKFAGKGEQGRVRRTKETEMWKG